MSGKGVPAKMFKLVPQILDKGSTCICILNKNTNASLIYKIGIKNMH